MKKLFSHPMAKAGLALSLAAASFAAGAASSFSGTLTGPSVTTAANNISQGISAGAMIAEGVLYLMGIIFLVLFILTILKWKKSDGRDGNVGLIVVYFLVASCSFAAPSLMGFGVLNLFGSGAKTVKVQTGSSVSNLITP